MTDPVETELVRRAGSDPAVVGLVLHGSRAAGAHDETSDYDIVEVVVGEDARTGRQRKERVLGAVVDVVAATIADVRSFGAERHWMLPAIAYGRVLCDRTGEVSRAVHALAEAGDDALAEAYDAYLNSFYRSLKAWRRGDELAGRMEAAESAKWLVETLFASVGRRAPYPSRLARELDALPLESVREDLLALLATGDPVVQQRVELRVARLLDERGARVVSDWHGEIERVRRFTFDR